MAARIAQFSLFAVALIIGILLVGQLRSQARPIELSSLSAQELSTLIEALGARNVELRTASPTSASRFGSYERAAGPGPVRPRAERGGSRPDRRVRRIARRRGAGNRGHSTSTARSTRSRSTTSSTSCETPGAEAIAIDDIRITASSVAVHGTGTRPSRSTASPSAARSRSAPSARRDGPAARRSSARVAS